MDDEGVVVPAAGIHALGNILSSIIDVFLKEACTDFFRVSFGELLPKLFEWFWADPGFHWFVFSGWGVIDNYHNAVHGSATGEKSALAHILHNFSFKIKQLSPNFMGTDDSGFAPPVECRPAYTDHLTDIIRRNRSFDYWFFAHGIVLELRAANV